MSAAASTSPAPAAMSHRPARRVGSERCGRWRTKPSTVSPTSDTRMTGAVSTPSRASRVHSKRVASRLTPAARPSRASGVEAPGQDHRPQRGAGQQEQEDAHHRRPDGGRHERDGIHEGSVLPPTGRVTSDLAVGRRVSGTLRSIGQRLAVLSRMERWLLVVLLLGMGVHGARALAPFFARGDLLYHWGLTETILLGTFPPEGPYAGLPAYYPPGFHLLLAGISRATGVDVPTATALLGIAWLPVIPLGAYLLTRRLTGRRDVALVAAILTSFGGGFDVSADRLWVNSMFMVGQAFVPVYPRDLVFGLLPFAILAFLRATEGEGRWLAWAVLAGGLLAAAG